MSQIPPPPVDFEALAEIDREIDGLLEGGGWSRERYLDLRARAAAAIGDHENALSFIDLLAESDWRPLPRVPMMTRLPTTRLPRATRDVVRKLRCGFRPYAALPVGRSLVWNGRKLAAHRIEAEIRPDLSRVIAELDPSELGNEPSFPDEFVPAERMDEVLADLLYGWNFRSTRAYPRRHATRLGGGRGTTALEIEAHQACASLGERAPEIWVIQLEVGHRVPIGNVNDDRRSITPDGSGRWETELFGLRFEGAYPYVLVGLSEARENRSYALVVESRGRPFDNSLVEPDLLALQFVLGQRIEVGLVHGLCGGDVVSVRSLGIGPKGGSENARAVSGPSFADEFWVVEFFARISAALRSPNHAELQVALHIVALSIDEVLDLAIQELVLAVASLTAAVPELSVLAPGSRASAFLARHGITMPAELAAGIDRASQTLGARGAFSVGSSNDDTHALVNLRADLWTVVVALVAVTVGYRGPIAGRPPLGEPPVWWPAPEVEPPSSHWTIAGPPQDATYGLREDQLLLLIENPDHEAIIRWLLRAADLPEDRIVVEAATSREDLREKIAQIKHNLGDRLLVIADVARGHVPTARERLRKDLDVDLETEVLPAIPCVEAWLLADDEFVSSHTDDPDTRRLATEALPDDVDDARALAHKIFGPPFRWAGLPTPDIYRAADRSPSLLHLLDVLSKRWGVKTDLPARSVARGISRDTIAGLMRSLLPDDAEVWRTSDGDVYTAASLAREIEDGTEVGRQYAVDLVSMMINTLSRSAKRARSA